MAKNQANLQPQKRVERLIFRDELTDAFNRRYLYQYLPQEISRSKNINQNVWVFMMDIDDFKSINDKYGHLRGDEVLKSVAEILKQCVRSEDIVIRYAGDEFTIVLSGADITGVTAIAKRINVTIPKTPIKSSSPGQLDINVNISIGIASFPDHATDAIRLIDLADKALYVSKQKGKNRISFVSDISSDMLRAKEILEIFPCPKLIERKEEIDKLLQFYSNFCKESKSKFILVSSDIGLGKSRLLDEFSKATEKKGITFFVKCSENLMAQPYGSLFPVLENFLKANTGNKKVLLNKLSSEQLKALVRMFPGMDDLFDTKGLGDAQIVENLEVDLEGLIKQLLLNISTVNKLSLIFDDFQWINENTLKLIFSLKKEGQNIFILCGLRNNAAVLENADYPVNRLKDALAENCDEEIVLKPLTLRGTGEMISSILLTMEMSQILDSLIYKVTKGNYLFVEELLKFLIQKGFIYYHKGNWDKIEIQESDIPRTLEEVILERFRGLDRSTQELISKAAVIGQDFNVELLRHLGKQDEGYILDILESAQKAGLIKTIKSALKGVSGTEELSFVSDEIRRILYNLIEQDKIKDLHKQVGEIQEGLHANNIDRIAGELFFHFKKAEDFHRAKIYAGKVKDAQGAVYDTALKYAQKILEGAEAKGIAPLSKKSLELSADIIRQLYILSINTMLYPSGSLMVTTPQDSSYENLTEIFVRDEALVFSQVKGALVVNGQRFKEGQLKKMFEENFLNFLKSNHIESISFKRGLSKPAFSDFINILTHPSEEKAISDEIKAKGIHHIEVMHISYDLASAAQRTQEREKLEENMLLDYLLSKISGTDKSDDMHIDWESRAKDMAKVLSQIAEKAATDEAKLKSVSGDEAGASAVQKTFQKIGSELLGKNPQDWDKYKKGLAKTIMNLEPKLRREVLLGVKPEEGLIKKDIIKEIASEFPDDVVIDLVSSELKEHKPSTPKIRYIVQKLLSDSDQKERITPLLKDKMTKLGFPTEDLPWVLGEQPWKDFDIEGKAKKFIQMTAEDYINLEDEIEINLLISEVLNSDRQDLFNAIIDKWKEFLKTEPGDLRHRITASFNRIVESIPLSRPELLVILLDIIFGQLQSEKQLDIYSAFLNQIANPLGCLVDSGNFAHAKIILENLNKENLRVKDSSELQKCINEARERIFTIERLRLITAEFIKRIDNSSYYDDLKGFMLNIGEPMVKPLVDAAMIEDKVLGSLGYFGAYLRRRGIGEMLGALVGKFGQQVLVDQLKEKLNDKEWYVVRNAIELFIYLHDSTLAGLLAKNLKHPNINIRKKVVFVLNRIGSAESAELLIEALNDPDASIRISAIQALSKIADAKVLTVLRNLRQPDLQAELNTAIESVEKLLGKKSKGE